MLAHRAKTLGKVCARSRDQASRRRTAMNAMWSCLLGAAAALWPVLSGADCHVASPNHTVALLELYTSEGCDSCPPADRWLSGLELGTPPLRAVALAFHVDYWDRLGWRDRFRSPVFTARHKEPQARRHPGLVFTPQAVAQRTALALGRGARPPRAALPP